MANSCLVLFCGLPGAGKSTFAANLFEILSNPLRKQNFLCTQENNDVAVESRKQNELGVNELLTDSHVVYICFDDIIPENLYKSNVAVNGSAMSDEKAWKSCRSCIAEFVDEFLNKHCHSSNSNTVFENGMCTISKGWDYVCNRLPEEKFCSCHESIVKSRRCDCSTKHIILLDDNMFYSSMRYKYFQMAKKYMAGFLQVYVSCNRETLIKQNSERAAAVSLETIEQMSSVFEIPNPEQNGWESNFIEISSVMTDMKSKLCAVLTMIGNSLQNPVPGLQEDDLIAKEMARKINLQNVLHQVDQVLRKYIASKIKELQADSQASKKWLQVQSSTLNSQKKSFIRGLKTSSATLRNLDNLLLGWCNTKLIPATSKCRDATSLCDQKPEALTEEHKEDSELLSNKDRFDNAVTILFKDYNKELI